MAEGLHRRGKRAHVGQLVFSPLARFVRYYILKLGFLEGWRGFLQACLAFHYGQMKYAKLLVLQQGSAAQKRPDPR
jgi:hypothetical protein